MRNKLTVLLGLLLLTLVPTLSASEVASEYVTPDKTPKWIEVAFDDKYEKSANEYQAVNITVKQYASLLDNKDTTINISYDPDIFRLYGVYEFTKENEVKYITEPTFTSSEQQFRLRYKLYVDQGVTATESPITITKIHGSKTETAKIMIPIETVGTEKTIGFDDIKMSYKVNNYSNDGATVNYEAEFKVLENPNNTPFTLSLKRNTMSVSSTDNYEVKVKFTGGKAVAVDKNNFKFNMTKGNSFKLDITADVAALTSKDDKFNFFIFLGDDNDFVRLTPNFFPSTGPVEGRNSKVDSDVIIYRGFIVLYALLCITLLISVTYNRRKAKGNKHNPKSPNKQSKDNKTSEKEKQQTETKELTKQEKKNERKEDQEVKLTEPKTARSFDDKFDTIQDFSDFDK